MEEREERGRADVGVRDVEEWSGIYGEKEGGTKVTVVRD